MATLKSLLDTAIRQGSLSALQFRSNTAVQVANLTNGTTFSYICPANGMLRIYCSTITYLSIESYGLCNTYRWFNVSQSVSLAYPVRKGASVTVKYEATDDTGQGKTVTFFPAFE